MTNPAGYVIRDYLRSDEPSWLRCRVLSFLATAYFDDVATSKPHIEAPGVQLVALTAYHEVVGLMDVVVEDTAGTIATLAVDPDHQRHGIARTLLAHAVTRLQTLDLAAVTAWTRDDSATLQCYRAMGFTESDHYLHVFANSDINPNEPARAVQSTRPGL